MKLPLYKRSVPSERRRPANEGRAPLYSYHTRRSLLPDTTGRQLFRPVLPAVPASRPLRYSLQRFGMVAVVLAVIISAVNVLMLSTSPLVLPLDADQGTLLRDRSIYQRAASTMLASSLLNRNKLTVDTGGISAALQRQFPELASVTVKLPLAARRPVIYLQPRLPVLVLHTMQGNEYLMDENGRALSDSRDAVYQAAHQLPLVRDASGAKVTVGQQALSASTVTFIRSVLFQLNHKGLKASTLVLPAAASELDVYLYGQAYFVKFNLASDTAQQQAGTFLAVRHRLQEQGVTPSQYVDVRVDGRAYYK